MIQRVSKAAPVQLHFAGAERIEIGVIPGELRVIRHGSRIEHYLPDAYQIVNGKARHLTVSYTFNGGDRVTVKFGNLDNQFSGIHCAMAL